MKNRVIQFGEGNFLRGFADYFIQKLNDKGLFDGGVVVVQPIENGMCDVLNSQHGKYNLFLRGIRDGEKVTEHTLVRCISAAINPYSDYRAFLELAENPDFRFIISNTTEAGIAYDESCLFDDAPPSSFPAKLTRLLYERYILRLPGFIILSCELIDNNGAELKKCVLRYAEKWALGNRFREWIINENDFCSTLVDRIVTGYPKDEAAALCREIGYEDRLLDTAEIFHLWVIEGNHEDELPLVRTGFNVVWTNDVTPYKKRKVRILNGSHTAMVPAALLSGLETVLDCMNDETVHSFLRRCLFGEIMPTLRSMEGTEAFAAAVLDRFSNPYIKHRLRSIALNSVSKFAVRVLPSIHDSRALTGEYPEGLMLSLSFLIYFYKNDVPEDVPEVAEFMKNADIPEILRRSDIWGEDLSDMEEIISADYEKISQLGARGAMQWVLSK